MKSPFLKKNLHELKRNLSICRPDQVLGLLLGKSLRAESSSDAVGALQVILQ